MTGRWAAMLLLTVGGCHRDLAVPAGMARVTIASAGGERTFLVEVAATAERQRRGLMGRTQLAADGGLLFAPYPPDGGPPTRAVFWMKDTPLPLDIVYIRADHRIDSIAADARPNDESFLPSDGPVAAVLEVAGGRTRTLGIRPGDMVAWQVGSR